MRRRLSHHVSPELFWLWCTELLGGFLLACLLLSAGLPEDTAGNLLRLHAIPQAAVLALTIGLVSFAVGLYSADMYGEPGRVLAGTALGGFVAVPVVWLAGRTAGIDFDALAGKGALPGELPGELIGLTLAGWTLFVLAVRLTPALLRERKVWGIIVTDAARNRLGPGQLADWRRGRIYGEAEFWESRLRRIDIDHPAASAGTQRLPAHRPPAHQTLDAALVRSGDILLSLALLLFTLPLMVAAALLIKLDSPGPVLYRQLRVGLRGRPFTLFKFRSMCVDAEARGPVWAASRDPRVTRVGAIIRLTRIDELPQLVNVLRGEMGFIGPRPERPHFVDRLAGTMPLYRERAQVKPGLTGWAQINYPSGASVEDARAKLSYDLYYVKHRSLMLAMLILFSTVWVVLYQKGAR